MGGDDLQQGVYLYRLLVLQSPAAELCCAERVLIDVGRTASFVAGLGDLPQSNSVHESRQPLASDPSTAQDPTNRNIYLVRHVIGLSTHRGTAEPGPTVANNHRVGRRDQPLQGNRIPMSGPTQELVEQKIAVPTLGTPTPTIGGPHLRNGNGSLTWLCHDGPFCDEGDVRTRGVRVCDVNRPEAATGCRFSAFRTEEVGSTECPVAGAADVVGSAADGGVVGGDEPALPDWTGLAGWTGRVVGWAALVSVGSAALVAGCVAVATAERLGRGGSADCSRRRDDAEVTETG